MASEKKPMRKSSVVSSFIFKYENDKPRVALFRRSGKVNTYQHHLAPISGSIERDDPSPLAAAWRELQEETTLTAASLALMRQGKHYSFTDESVGREWTIYPFAFRLKTPEEGGQGEAGLQIDWEHEGWEWHDPADVEDSDRFGGVPFLAESLRRVWFEKDLGEAAGAALARGLDRLRNDHESGARQLATAALQVLRDVIVELDAAADDHATTVAAAAASTVGTGNPPAAAVVAHARWWTRVRLAAWHIWKNGREAMGAAILSVLLAALKSMEDTLGQHKAHPDSSHSMKWRDAILEDLARRIALRSSDSAKLVSNALVQYLTSQFREKLESARPLAILTLSESSTITHGLRTLLLQARFSLDLRILESRPLYEGVSLAGSLLNLNGIVPAQGSSPRESSREVGGGDQGSASATKASQKLKISLFTDASAALAARDVDVVVVGADRIASNGAVSNKTGTLPAMLSARHVANGNGNGSRPVKVIVLSESEKVAPREDHEDHVVEDNDPTQLIRAWGAEYNGTRVQEAAALIAKRLRGDAGGDDHGRRLPIVEVAVHNIFFEWCPPELIDVYLTEYGEWAAQDIREHAERLGAERERLFADI